MDELRQRARRRYAERCGYCGIQEDHAGAVLTIDTAEEIEQEGA